MRTNLALALRVRSIEPPSSLWRTESFLSEFGPTCGKTVSSGLCLNGSYLTQGMCASRKKRMQSGATSETDGSLKGKGTKTGSCHNRHMDDLSNVANQAAESDSPSQMGIVSLAVQDKFRMRSTSGSGLVANCAGFVFPARNSLLRRSCELRPTSRITRWLGLFRHVRTIDSRGTISREALRWRKGACGITKPEGDVMRERGRRALSETEVAFSLRT